MASSKDDPLGEVSVQLPCYGGGFPRVLIFVVTGVETLVFTSLESGHKHQVEVDVSTAPHRATVLEVHPVGERHTLPVCGGTTCCDRYGGNKVHSVGVTTCIL